jgi:hypothetical protein
MLLVWLLKCPSLIEYLSEQKLCAVCMLVHNVGMCVYSCVGIPSNLRARLRVHNVLQLTACLRR